MDMDNKSKSERLFDLLENANVNFIEETRPGSRQLKERRMARLIPLAACLTLAALAGVFFAVNGTGSGMTPTDAPGALVADGKTKSTDEKDVKGDAEDTTDSRTTDGADIGAEPAADDDLNKAIKNIFNSLKEKIKEKKEAEEALKNKPEEILKKTEEEELKRAYYSSIEYDWGDGVTADDVIILGYYGKYNGSYAARFDVNCFDHPQAIDNEVVDGVRFVYPMPGVRILIYDGTEFHSLADAFEKGLITHSDLSKMAKIHKERYPGLYTDVAY